MMNGSVIKQRKWLGIQRRSAKRTRRISDPKKSYAGLNRPKRLRQWTNYSMLRAMNAVKNGLMGQNRAALEYGVPCTTLKDRLSGKVVHGTSMGPKPYLTHEEEK